MVTSHCEDLYKLRIYSLSQILEIFQSGIHFNETKATPMFQLPISKCHFHRQISKVTKIQISSMLDATSLNDQYCVAVFNPLYTGTP